MARSGRDPLAGIDLLVVDGNNLLHALGGGPTATVLGRLRAVIPAAIAIDLVFDGPAAGNPTGRVATGMHVRFSGRRSADDVILDRLDSLDVRPAIGDAPRALLVTDDAALARAAQARGASTTRTAWLTTRLDRERLAAPAPGNPRPAAPTTASIVKDGDGTETRAGWQPGRGATTKRGNAWRRPRHARHRSH